MCVYIYIVCIYIHSDPKYIDPIGSIYFGSGSIYFPAPCFPFRTARYHPWTQREHECVAIVSVGKFVWIVGVSKPLNACRSCRR